MDRIVGESEWFARARVDDAVWHLWEPYVDPFARCNIWFVQGRDRNLLVDSGMGIVSLHTAAGDLFGAGPLIALATHYHFDHVGSLHEFAHRWTHPAAAPYLTDSSRIGGGLRRARFDPDDWQSFLDAGYTLGDDLLTAWPRRDFDVDAYSVTPCTPTRTLSDGDAVDLGDRAFAVLHLPGHSPDSIGLFDERSGVLFSGDAVYDGPLLDGGGDSDIDDYVSTMERLRALPVTVVHGGHEASFGRARLVELCDGYLARVS